MVVHRGGPGIRVAMKAGPFRRTPQQDAIFQKVISSNASEDEMKTFREFQNQRVDESLAEDENTLLKIEKVSPEPPEKSRIFRRLPANSAVNLSWNPERGFGTARAPAFPVPRLITGLVIKGEVRYLVEHISSADYYSVGQLSCQEPRKNPHKSNPAAPSSRNQNPCRHSRAAVEQWSTRLRVEKRKPEASHKGGKRPFSAGTYCLVSIFFSLETMDPSNMNPVWRYACSPSLSKKI